MTIPLDTYLTDTFSYHVSTHSLYQVRGNDVRLLGTFDGAPRRPEGPLSWFTTRTGVTHAPLDGNVAGALLTSLGYTLSKPPLVPHLEVFVSDSKYSVEVVPDSPKSRELRQKPGWYFVGTIPVTPPPGA